MESLQPDGRARPATRLRRVLHCGCGPPGARTARARPTSRHSIHRRSRNMTATTAATRTPDCNHCRRRPAAPERTRCRPCLDKAAANSRKRYARLAAKASCTHCRPTPRHARRIALLRLRARPAEVVAATRPAPGTSRPSAVANSGHTATNSKPTRRRRHPPHRAPLRRVRRLRRHRTRRRAGPRRHHASRLSFEIG